MGETSASSVSTLMRNRSPSRETACWSLVRPAALIQRTYPGDDVLEYDLAGNAIDAAPRPMALERFLHGESYRPRAGDEPSRSLASEGDDRVHPRGAAGGEGARPDGHGEDGERRGGVGHRIERADFEEQAHSKPVTKIRSRSRALSPALPTAGPSSTTSAVR